MQYYEYNYLILDKGVKVTMLQLDTALYGSVLLN